MTSPMDLEEKYLVFDFEKYLEKDYGPARDDEPGEICKFFLKGSCTKGTSCPFKHNRGDRAVVCKHWLRGLCKKSDNCEFLHEYNLSKMPECFFFSKFGECSNPECQYLHINPEDKLRDCPWFARGFCKHGTRCHNKHVKKTACANYIIGFCPDGPNCKYGHPKYELPRDEEPKAKTVRTPIVCHKCNQTGHKAANCPKAEKEVKERGPDGRPIQRPLESIVCYKCGQNGHYANHCTGTPQQIAQRQDSAYEIGCFVSGIIVNGLSTVNCTTNGLQAQVG
ncbi:cleavage and polyadenylation specificity factor, putative-like [Planoprotostelium fungivorum]|uniref:Cleavage and polyadenylation specificity factor, putative-like n=1 Tax=Planoprotostelium fungivorum TaxID=1890364 RepID=A0A2P6N3Z0_9EUKA|nr:cleavage and polyadenylation specificity factor, putative-like [Planoprotostelium fungivorum]